MALALVLGLPSSGPGLLLLSRVLWAASAFCALGLFALSLMSYYWRRWLTLRRLRACVLTGAGAQKSAPIEDMICDLARRARCPTPQLAVTSRSDPYAGVYEFGLLKRERYIELSVRFIETLERDEIEAVLAHELGHFMSGHCTRHNLLHILARLTFVGGGFVSGIENSFGNELEADRVAVSLLSVRPQVLRSCLENTLATLALDSLKRHRMSVGLALAQSSGALGRSSAWARGEARESLSLSSRIRLWLSIYASDVDVFSYWHPSLRERIELLKAMEEPP